MHNAFPALRAARAALALLVAVSIASSCRAGGSEPAVSVRIGTTKGEVNALLLIAEHRGYFDDNNVEVMHQIYSSGVVALDGLLAGEVDLATGSEFAFVHRVLAGDDVCALAVINRSSIEYVVARVDRGIRTVADLEGKTIGVLLGSRPEFALDRFLFFRGIDQSEVTLVDVPVDRWVDALVSGEVDAVAAWQPYIDEMRARMGEGVVVWSAQEDQPSYTLLMSQCSWADGNQEAVARALKALIRAERWVAANPDKARAFVEEKWDYSEAYVASVWPDYTFSVLLDQTLIMVMEDQARWIIERDLAGRAQTPNFLRYIYFDGLDAVAPETVNVIR